MTLADQMRADIADVFLNTEEHARDILVTPPRGRDAVSVTGVWDISEQDKVETERGKEVIIQATFISESSVVIQCESTALVDGVTWTCRSPGADDVGLKMSHWTTNKRINSGSTGAK